MQPTEGAATPRPVRLDTDLPQLLLGAILVVAALFAADALGNPYWTYNFQLIGVLLIVAVFQNFLLVDAGQVSFGQGAVFGAAAYLPAILTSMHGWPLALSALGGLGAALAVGLLFALPALRVQGYYLGFVTFSAAIVFPELVIAFNDLTNGINGIPLKFDSLVARGALGISPLTAAIAAACCAALAFHVAVRRTRFGRALRVAAASPEAAQSLGTNPGLMRSLAFLIAALGTGFAGVLYIPVVGFISPSNFGVELSMLFFFAVIVGGRGQPLGPIAGMAVLYILPNMLLAAAVNFRLLIYGGIALGVMLAFPDGLIGSLERWRRRRLNRRADAAVMPISAFVSVAPQRAAPPAAGNPALVEVREARKSFGRIQALAGVDLAVREGEIHGLIGANGSGKTSLLNVLSGFSRLDSGSYRFRGRETGGLPAHRIARLGLGRTFQTPRIFEALSAWENIEIGLDARPAAAPPVPAAVRARLEHDLAGCAIERVPHGQRRLLEVLRVVLKGADLLLLDEPAAGLSVREREAFSALLRRIRDDLGKTIILVEHDLDLVLGIADRVTVLEAGSVIASGTPDELAGNAAVRWLFVGTVHA